MDNRIGYVYLWINKVNLKWYLGSHVGNFRTEKYYMGSGSMFLRAVSKYGKDKFHKKILYEGKDFRYVEGVFLKIFKAKEDPNSYNLINNSAHCPSEVAKLIGNSKNQKKMRSERAKRQHREGNFGRATWSKESKDRDTMRPRKFSNEDCIKVRKHKKNSGLSNVKLGEIYECDGSTIWEALHRKLPEKEKHQKQG